MTGSRRIPLVAAALVAVAVVGTLWLQRFRSKTAGEDPATVRREIAALTLQRDSIRAIVLETMDRNDVLDRRPAGDVVIGLPKPFVDTVLRSVVTGWFHDVDLRLPRMRVRKDGEVRARLGILGRRKVGNYHVAIILDDVRGRLQPGVPTTRFGGDTIHLALPVRLVSGTGVARITADWESTGLAGPVCGDMTVRRDVTGAVRAKTYTAHGRLMLSAIDGAVLADPDFPALALRIYVDPSDRSVAALDSLLDSRGGLCGYAVDRSGASARIQAMVARGFRVKIPQKFFRPVTLPVSVQTSVTVADSSVSLTVVPSQLSVTASTVWIGAQVALTPRKPPR